MEWLDLGSGEEVLIMTATEPERKEFTEEFQSVLDRFVGPKRMFSTKSDLARAADVSKSNLTRYVTPGQAHQPRAKILSRLSAALLLPDDYLYNLWAYCNALTAVHPDTLVRGRAVGDSKGGANALYRLGRRVRVFEADEITSAGWEIDPVPGPSDRAASVDSDDPEAFYVVVSGPAMTGSHRPGESISEGDILLVEPGGALADDDIVIARDDDGSVTVRRFCESGGEIRLISLMDDRPPIVDKSGSASTCFPISEIRKRTR